MKFNIQLKISLLVTVLMGILVMGIYFYLNDHLTKFAFQRIHTNLIQDALFVQRDLTQLKDRDRRSLQEWDAVADEIGRVLDLRVTIVDHAGRVLGDSHVEAKKVPEMENHLSRPEFQAALSIGQGESQRYSTTISREFLYFALPFGDDAFRGFVRLSIPLSDIDAISAKLRKLLLNAFLVFFLLSISILGFFLNALIVRPIKEMSKVTEQIALGDFSQRPTLTTGDEFEDLSHSLRKMSEQIRAKIEEVSTGRSRLEAVFLSMSEGVMVLDRNGVILLVNETLKNLLNMTGTAEGRKPLEVIRHLEIQETAEQLLQMRQGLITKEIHVLVPEEKVLMLHATPVKRSGVVEGGVMVFHDITDLRRLERIRQEFAANVSHELRTPVATIKGYAETLLDGAIDDKKNAKDFLRIMHADSERLAKLINDILDLSKIESGKAKMDFQLHDIEEVIHRAISATEKMAKEKGVKVSLEVPSPLPKMALDDQSMTQMFINLIENAIKYNKPQGMVSISVLKKERKIEISVRDTGIGIPEEDLPRVFERFYRVDKARSRELGGTGLGLSIVKHIIQAHQGEIKVESILDQGSVFTISLPVG